jgi:phytoene dehydrogenase-like protein
METFFSERPEIRFDACVIGGGLAGFTAGLFLQRAGLSVVIVERRAKPGGLCGTHSLEGREYVIACNDFGQGLATMMGELGVDIEFEPRKTRFHLEAGIIDVPPTPSTLLRLARNMGDYGRAAFAILRGSEEDLASFIERGIRSPQATQLLGSLAYPVGRSPKSVSLASLRTEFSKEYSYGYARPSVPRGGPQALADAMLDRFEALGGVVRLSTECLGVDLCGGVSPSKTISTPGGDIIAKRVISSEGRWGEYPADQRPGFAVSTLHLAVQKDFPFPDGFHTLVHVPERVGRWLDLIDEGQEPECFPFHLFRSDLPAQPDHYTMNAYIYLPRGIDTPETSLVERAREYFFDNAESMLPGLRGALLAEHFISPSQFRKLHGLSPRVVERIAGAGFQKPDPYDKKRDLFFIGNSVQPPGDHAGAAVLSARRVAERILKEARA